MMMEKFFFLSILLSLIHGQPVHDRILAPGPGKFASLPCPYCCSWTQGFVLSRCNAEYHEQRTAGQRR